ncbi:hypothetical protein PR048_022383 [Dryococelus australis]|uniref:Uncharacterized protein n=1 Tax=Dryococelus australis TaxID=614101 RepID=A0ABQ9H0W6_9NEOP|nr:hypothetical protein PR048_022383 [Dryococelus australis]
MALASFRVSSEEGQVFNFLIQDSAHVRLILIPPRCRGGEMIRLLASLAGSLPYIRTSELCRTMPLVGVFSRRSPVFAAIVFQRWAILESPFIGSQDHNFKSRPNLSTSLSGPCPRPPFSLLLILGDQSMLINRRGGGRLCWLMEGRPLSLHSVPMSPRIVYSKCRHSGHLNGSWQSSRPTRARETGYPREHSPTSGIVLHFDYVRKSCATPSESNPIRLAKIYFKHLCVFKALVVGLQLVSRSRGGVVVRILSSHLREIGSFPGGVAPEILHVGIVPGDSSVRRVFSGISRFSRPYIPALLHTHLASPSSALKTSMLRAAQISALAGMKGRGETGDPREKPPTHGTIPTCENPVTRPRIEPGSPWWKASVLIAHPLRPHTVGCCAPIGATLPLPYDLEVDGKSVCYHAIFLTTSGRCFYEACCPSLHASRYGGFSVITCHTILAATQVNKAAFVLKFTCYACESLQPESLLIRIPACSSSALTVHCQIISGLRVPPSEGRVCVHAGQKLMKLYGRRLLVHVKIYRLYARSCELVCRWNYGTLNGNPIIVCDTSKVQRIPLSWICMNQAGGRGGVVVRTDCSHCALEARRGNMKSRVLIARHVKVTSPADGVWSAPTLEVTRSFLREPR